MILVRSAYHVCRNRMAIVGDTPLGLTGPALDRLLARLSSDRDTAAREYKALHARLVDFFDWRGAFAPETLADETIDRLARKLDDGVEIGHLASYVRGVARLVLLEWHKGQARKQRSLAEWRPVVAVPTASPDGDAAQRVACLRRCLQALPEETRELIVRYYESSARSRLEGRKALAEELGLSYVNLKTKAHRVRVRLEECLKVCLGRDGL